MRLHKVTAENVASLVVEETLASCVDYQAAKRLKVQLYLDPSGEKHSVLFVVYSNLNTIYSTTSLNDAVEKYNGIEV